MELVKDKAGAKWWLWLWGLVALVAAALIAGALWWRQSSEVQDVAAQTYALVKVATDTADQHSVAATIALPCKPEQKAILESHQATVAAALSTYLTSASGGALADPRNRAELLKALLETANQSLPPELKLDRVLFTAFVVGS